MLFYYSGIRVPDFSPKNQEREYRYKTNSAHFQNLSFLVPL